MLSTVVLDDAAALEEIAAFVAELEPQLAQLPATEDVPVEAVRKARRAGSGAFPAPVLLDEAEEHEVPRRDGGTVALRVLRPSGAVRGAYLHIHGGGWVLGARDEQDLRLKALAEATGLVAVSVEYRLAPEHPHPAGADDVEDAARWLVREGAAALGCPAALTIGGESAGGHLAALTLQRLRDGHGLGDAFCAANLVFGAFDLGMTPSQKLWGDRRLILSGPLLRYFGDCFLPGRTPAARGAPDVSPLHADLRGLPPALLTVGTLDPLLDDSLLMAQGLSDAGGEAELHLLPGAFHAYTAFPDLGVSRIAEAAEHRFLSRRVAAWRPS